MAIALEKETALRCEEMPTDCGGREKKNLNLSLIRRARSASVFVPMVSGKGRVGGLLPRSGATTRPSESRHWWW